MDIINIVYGKQRQGSDPEKIDWPKPESCTTSDNMTPSEDAFFIRFKAGDCSNPKLWSRGRKALCVAHLVIIGFWVTLASSASSATHGAVSDELGVSRQVSEMSTSLYLFGFACGSILMAPLSEEFGRLPVYIVSMAAFGLFHVGAALASNITTLAVCRFFAGFFGTSPLSNAGGSLVDMFTPLQITLIFPIFGSLGFIGPIAGPLVGAALTQQYGWRWTYWVIAIVGLFIAISCFFFMQESYAPVLLDHRARAIRRVTSDQRFRSEHEIALAGRSPFNVDTFKRPFVLAFSEPIVTLFALYLSVVYVVLFANLEAYPLVYEQYGFNLVQVSLAFLPINVGVVLVLAWTTTVTYRHYARAETDPSVVITPETRLYTLLYACWLIPVSLFWIAWTSRPSLSPWASMPSGLLFGGGLIQVFVGAYMYIMAVYGAKSSSALAVLTFIRYNFSGLAIHAAEPWMEGMGLEWAYTLLALISLALCAIPFVFYWKGPIIRSWSQFTA